jgi:hypothetical protein
MAAGMGLGVINATTRQAEACPTIWPAPDYGTDCARAPVASLDVRQQWAEIDGASSYVRGVHPLAGDPRRLEIHLAHELAAYLKTA